MTDQLKSLSLELIDPATERGEAFHLCRQMNQLFCDLLEQNPYQDQFKEDIFTSGGKAIGTIWAAFCTLEFRRTQQFLRGIYKALENLLAKQQKVHVFYAGSGPFATLILPFTTLYSSDQLQVTILEINPDSISILHQLIHALGKSAYFKDIIQADATEYNLREYEREHTDLFITETMLQGLETEPQVAISLQLVPQFQKKVIMIPDEIRIDASLIHAEKRDQYWKQQDLPEEAFIKPLKEIFRWNTNNLLQFAKSGTKQFPFKKIPIPNPVPEGFGQLCLLTSIRVFGDHHLTLFDTSITNPLPVFDLSGDSKEVEFQYQIGTNPGFLRKLS
jgi:hypothetical protein